QRGNFLRELQTPLCKRGEREIFCGNVQESCSEFLGHHTSSKSNISPAGQPLRCDGDHRPVCNGHAPILGIFLTQELYGLFMPLAAQKNPGSAADQNVSEPAPGILVVVHDQGYLWILCDVAKSPKASRALGLFVDGRKKFLAVEGKADRNNQWLPTGVGGG